MHIYLVKPVQWDNLTYVSIALSQNKHPVTHFFFHGLRQKCVSFLSKIQYLKISQKLGHTLQKIENRIFSECIMHKLNPV